ncbi:MAG: ECF transporter S component [Tissierellia bacterium]|nr:ECF transporter S component [Tissierellia bacterium]
MYTLRKEDLNVKTMTKIAILGVISFVFMLLDFPLWFTPTFLKFDISDLPSLIGAFALGPMAGVLVQLIKNLLKLLLAGTNTAAVGELANFVVGSVFAYTAGFIYYREKTFKNAIIGLIVGVLTMTVVISFANYYIMIPFYSKAYGLPLEKIIAMSTAVNKYIVDLKSLIIFGVVPFNLLKGLVTSILTVLLYKRISPILKN